MFEFHKLCLLGCETKIGTAAAESCLVDQRNFFFPCWELSDGLQSGDTAKLSQIDPGHRDFAPKEDNKKQMRIRLIGSVIFTIVLVVLTILGQVS